MKTATQGLRTQQGAATLLLVLGLVLLGTLASAWSSRAALLDLLGSRTREQAQQARNAAQAALATAQAELLQAFGQDPVQDPFADPSQALACPPDLPGPRWQCARLPLVQRVEGWETAALLARDLIAAPHLWQLRAWAEAGRGQASVRETLFAPVLAPAPAASPASALLLNGCLAAPVSAQLQLCPAGGSGAACSGSSPASAIHSLWVPDVDGDGHVSAAERKACMDLTPTHLPAGGQVTATPMASPRSPCARAAWRSVFGEITDRQLQAWSDAQARQGLHPLSEPPRNMYWVDSPADWTQSVGRPDAPVLLVFSQRACAGRCPRIASHVQIHGTVFVDARCDDEKLRGWQAGTIDGMLVLEAGWPAIGGPSWIRASSQRLQALALHWPAGLDSRSLQRVAGSHREGAP